MDTDQLQMEAEIALVGYVDWNMARDCDTQVALQVFDGGVVEFVRERQLDEPGPLFERDVEPFADVPCQVAQLRRPQRVIRVGAQRQAGVRPAAGHLLDVGEEGVEGLLRQEGRGPKSYNFVIYLVMDALTTSFCFDSMHCLSVSINRVYILLLTILYRVVMSERISLNVVYFQANHPLSSG